MLRTRTRLATQIHCQKPPLRLTEVLLPQSPEHPQRPVRTFVPQQSRSPVPMYASGRKTQTAASYRHGYEFWRSAIQESFSQRLDTAIVKICLVCPCELRPVELHFEVAEAETENVGTHSGRRDPKPALIGHDHKLDARSLCSPPSNFLWRAPALQVSANRDAKDSSALLPAPLLPTSRHPSDYVCSCGRPARRANSGSRFKMNLRSDRLVASQGREIPYMYCARTSHAV